VSGASGAPPDGRAPDHRIDFLPALAPESWDAIASLAHEIWYEHYVPIIGREQVDYMVPKFQSSGAIAAQVARGQEYWLVSLDGDAAGYLCIEPQPEQGRMFLSKLYVRSALRGSGLGQAALAFIESHCRQASLTVLWLTVNRFNPALAFYERQGFVNVAEVVADIGGGYVMDDYRMEKVIR
jgi:diamine N-acetyltransferase